MNKIKFRDEEVDFLRDQYQAELAETEKYLAHLKSILKKLGPPKPSKPQQESKPAKQPGKRGRKPKASNEITAPVVGVGTRKPRSDKGRSRANPADYMLTTMVIDSRKPSEIKKNRT